MEIDKKRCTANIRTTTTYKSLMIVVLIAVVLLLLVSSACATVDPAFLANLSQEQSATATTSVPVAAVGAEGAVRNESITVNAGTTISYTVILPPDYAIGEAYPTLLALPPGSQTQSMVDAGLDSYWWAGALANDWVVISPVAPAGQLFFQGSEALIPDFLDQIAQRYPPEGDKFHLSGVSNGGISAFRIAGLHPERFHSLLALPGYPQTAEDKTNLAQLTALPVALFVGANDAGWIDPMRETVSLLNNQGGSATLAIVPDEGHFIRSLMGGEQLFAFLEEVRRP